MALEFFQRVGRKHTSIFSLQAAQHYMYMLQQEWINGFTGLYIKHTLAASTDRPRHLVWLDWFPRERIQMPPLDVTLPRAWLFPWQSNQKDSLRLLLLRWKVVNHTAADTHRVVGAGELVKPNDKAPRCTKYAAAISAAELMLIHGCFSCWTDIYRFQLHGWERIENAFVPAACVVCA